MNTLHEEIRMRAARGDVLSREELLEIARGVESLINSNRELTQKTQRLEAKVGVLTSMNEIAFAAAGSSRTIDEMRSNAKEVCSSTGQLFNAFEVNQLIHAFDISESRLKTMQKDYDRISRCINIPIGVEAMVKAIENGDVRPFSFQDVAAMIEVQHSTSTLSRPVKNNLKEIFDLLKARPDALFYGSEVRAIRKWGADHDRNLSLVKSRLGRAFTDPVGYMDKRFDLMLSKDTKRQLLDGRVISAQSYQDAVFSRPDFLKIPEDWVLMDGRTQFHAGHFHTHPSSGKWWCGIHFRDMTAATLMNTLETALAELRLLYIHFPKGVLNETA